jgi:H+-transporting ATPase
VSSAGTVEAGVGLTEAEAARRLAEYGENAPAEHHVSAMERLAHFFWGPIPWMIEIAAVLSASLGHWGDLAIILAMLFISGSRRNEDVQGKHQAELPRPGVAI